MDDVPMEFLTLLDFVVGLIFAKPSTNFHEFTNGKAQIRAFMALFVDGLWQNHKFCVGQLHIAKNLCRCEPFFGEAIPQMWPKTASLCSQ